MAKPNTDFVDDAPVGAAAGVNTDFVDDAPSEDVAPSDEFIAENPTAFIDAARKENRVTDMPNGLVYVKAKGQDFGQAFDPKTGQVVLDAYGESQVTGGNTPRTNQKALENIIGFAQSVNPLNDEFIAGTRTAGQYLQGKPADYASNLKNIRSYTEPAEDASMLPTKLAGGIAQGVLVPTPEAKTRLLSLLARTGVNALQGGANAAAMAREGESRTSQGLKGAGISAGLTLGGGTVAAAGQGLINKGSKIVSNAAQKAFDMAQAKAEKLFNKARGGLGGDSNAALHTIDELKTAAESLNVPDEQKQRILSILQSEQAKQLEQNALNNQVKLWPTRQARLSEAEQAFEEAVKNKAPEAVQAAQQEILSDAVTPVTSRLKRHISKLAAPIGVGADYALGTFPLFTGAGSAVSAFGGQPMTVFQNMVQNPAVMDRMGKAVMATGQPFKMLGDTAQNPMVNEYIRKMAMPVEEKKKEGIQAYQSAE